MPAKLTLDDIADLRAYEREREAFRDHVIALKRKRRVPVGPVITLVFENRDTVRFQIQEMARAERMLTDEQIQVELDIYNPLIPGGGTLVATLFVELTSDDELREWLPKLVGVERSVELRIGDDLVVRSRPEAAHEEQLTRPDITSSVHYVYFDVPDLAADRLSLGAPVVVAVDHPHYRHEARLGAETVAELSGDLRD